MAAPTLYPASVTQRTNAGSTAIIVDVPPSVQAGDLIVAHCRQQNATMSITDLNGFTLVDQVRQASGAASSFVVARVATASEPASYTITSSVSAAGASAAVRVSGQHATLGTALEASNGIVTTSAVTPITIPAVTTLGADRLIMWFATTSGAGGNTFDWTDATLDTNEYYDFISGTNRSMAGSWETQAAAGSTGSEDVNLSATLQGQGHVLAIAPAVVGGGVELSGEIRSGGDYAGALFEPPPITDTLVVVRARW